MSIEELVTLWLGMTENDGTHDGKSAGRGKEKIAINGWELVVGVNAWLHGPAVASNVDGETIEIMDDSPHAETIERLARSAGFAIVIVECS